MVTPSGVGSGSTLQSSEVPAETESVQTREYSKGEHSFVQTPLGSSQTFSVALGVHPPSGPPSEVSADAGQVQSFDEQAASKVTAIRAKARLRELPTGTPPFRNLRVSHCVPSIRDPSDASAFCRAAKKSRWPLEEIPRPGAAASRARV